MQDQEVYIKSNITLGAHLQSARNVTVRRSRAFETLSLLIGEGARKRWRKLQVSMAAYLSRYTVHLFRSSASIVSRACFVSCVSAGLFEIFLGLNQIVFQTTHVIQWTENLRKKSRYSTPSFKKSYPFDTTVMQFTFSLKIQRFITTFPLPGFDSLSGLSPWIRQSKFSIQPSQFNDWITYFPSLYTYQHDALYWTIQLYLND